ncbi:MAG TPA: GAF domain-containing sensor histidine kinase [Pelovirga sp.]|nr:GAF domain-containing sensor histidine kinase [Pelovirga sp.]
MKPYSFPAQLSFITDLFSNTRLRQDFVASIVDKLQVWTGCHCVGIRIVNPDDFMPYEAYVGFSQEFWEHENWLSLREHQCGCTRIVNNEILPVDMPLLTENGSILSNDLQGFGASLSAEDAGLYRGKCVECGFGSLALVPIRKEGEIIGLIHLADMRTNLLPPEMIQTLEALTMPIAEVIERFSTEDRLSHKQAEMEQFVYGVSHDLKSPLITIRTFLAMLQQDLLNEDQHQVKEDLNYIDKAAGKIQQLLDSLLEYSHIDRKDVPAQTLSVAQQLEDCLSSLAGILQNHGIQVTVSNCSLELRGDPLHFSQIWQNLIENAVKYMGNQAQPQIEIGVTRQGQDQVFYVRDNGMGIKPEHCQRIFHLFSQLNSESGGSGLGLALVKKIVSNYQGRVWVESAGEGKGSCFRFTLPGALVRSDQPR